MRVLIYEDGGTPKAQVGDRVKVLELGLTDTVGLRNAKRFRTDEVEPCEAVVVVGDHPEIVKAYQKYDWEKARRMEPPRIVADTVAKLDEKQPEPEQKPSNKAAPPADTGATGTKAKKAGG